MVSVVVVSGDADRKLVSTLEGAGATVHVALPSKGLFARIAKYEPAAVVLALDEPLLGELAGRMGPEVQLIALARPLSIAQRAGEPDTVLSGAFDTPTIERVLAGPTPGNTERVLAELLGLGVFGTELDATLQELTSRVARAFEADDCVLLLSEETTGYTAQQVSDEVLEQLVPLCETACELATSLIVPAHPGRPYRSFLGVPLAQENAAPFALLMLCRREPVPFHREVRRHLRLFAQRLSLDLSWRLVSERLQADREKLHDLSRTDPVLGVANRLALQEHLSQKVAASERRGEPFSVAVIDVDALHLINERHGYRAGDAVLAHIALAARQRASATEMVARYASDAIAIVLPGTSAEDAATKLTRILSDVDSTPVVHEGTTINLTLSAGIAELHYEDDTGEAALGRAAAARQRARVTGDVIAIADNAIVADPPAPPDYAIGTTLGGVYQIRHEISRGAFGVVYRAEDLSLGRQVALKLLRPDLATDTAFVDRFRGEAAMLARIRNPNLVQVYAFGIDGSHVYFAMELVEGQGLEQRISSARKRRRHLPLPDVASVIDQVGDALEALHRAGILHRDVKPENVLIDRIHRRCVLVDVGIAVPRDGEKNPAGTPGFTAPEVFGDAGETPATDVYSLGALAYMLLTLQPPFGDADPYEILKAQARAPAPPTKVRGDLPAGVEQVLMPALDPDPGNRPQSARALAKALAAALAPSSGKRSQPRMTLQPPPDFSLRSASLRDARPRVTVRNASSQRGHATVTHTTRGILFRSAYEVLGARRGRVWIADISRNQPQLAAVVAPQSSALAWHPTSAFISVLESLAEDDAQRLALAAQLGRVAVDATLDQFYGANPSASGPVHVLRSIETIWRYYHSWGTATATAEDRSAEVLVTGGIASALLCSATSGLLVAVATHAGANGVELEHTSCVAKGGKRCVYELAWRTARKRPSL